jgi:hypothetical protein
MDECAFARSGLKEGILGLGCATGLPVAQAYLFEEYRIGNLNGNR